tara:strand:+ start:9760 stop:10986 length:1227 start_codon:yes stop_codon:yes gene_type:complete
MNFLVSHPSKKIKNSFNISGSKSESNRLLILKHLLGNIEINNLSDSDDTNVLRLSLSSKSQIIDVGHAGTAMRFLTSYLSIQENKSYEIYGSERMHNRPIKILVDSLNDLGADIKYLGKKGYPPLKINGKKFDKFNVHLDANISSQYISALILIAPSLKKGLVINLKGDVTSRPYIEMSLSMLRRIGVKATFVNNRIDIKPFIIEEKIVQIVESDWSSLSYFYSIAALSNESDLNIGFYFSNSIQGDKKLIEIYQKFGVQTLFANDTINLKKDKDFILPEKLIFELNDHPDLAQTISVTCFGLGVACDLYGLKTLKIKETDRLIALKNELEKLGAKVDITNQSLHLKKRTKFNPYVIIDTYEDHRMAMAFTPLALLKPIIINNPKVISKSFPSFWKTLSKLCFEISEY